MEGRRTEGKVGLSQRSWDGLWRAEMDTERFDTTYATIDATLKWAPGTARALHCGEEVPAQQNASPDGLASLREEVSELAERVDVLASLVLRKLGREE